jgi:DNA polymerase II small subunit
MSRPDLQKNLVSINKISSDRASLSIIGIVTEKRITKNKNMILLLEDLTGEIGILVKFDREELFKKAEELQLDDVVGIKASGNRDLLFVHDIIFPDICLYEKTKFENEVCAAFLSDLHCGGNRHLKKSFQNFLNWVSSDDIVAKKVKYLFFTGDNVDGVGIFPNQEAVLELKSMKEQYELLVSYLKKIPKSITMFMCPGQHDAVRVAEPQPLISRKYAPELYNIDNLVLVTNPALVKLIEGEKEFKILMYHGASIHTFINEIKELRLAKAHKCPAKAVKYMLKRRHLAPMHGVSPSIVYIPNAACDPLVISEVPDVLITGEMHRPDVDNYNGVLIITGSCWQAQTPYEEKIGTEPDPAKVPILNLKTRELKIYDFGDLEEMKRGG